MTAAVGREVPIDQHPLADALQAQMSSDVWDLRIFGCHDRTRRARFRGRTDRAGRGATDIWQEWLLNMTKEWVFRAALRKVSGSYIDDVILSMALLSATLRERPDRGERPEQLSHNDITAHLMRLGELHAAGFLSDSGQRRAVCYLAKVLEDGRAIAATAGKVHKAARPLPEGFVVLRSDLPRRPSRGDDEPSRALPRIVVRQLLDPVALEQFADQSGEWAVAWFRIALGTGRRPDELANLPLIDCLDHNTYRDDQGVERTQAVLVHDMPKVGIVGYRLPITSETASLIQEQQLRVRSAFPDTDPNLLPLFPAPFHNPTGVRPVPTWQVATFIRSWVNSLPALLAPEAHEDGRAGGPIGAAQFPRWKVYPYALRHTWAQDHADAGTPLEVLQDLMGHRKPGTTQGYFRMTHARRRDAVIRLSRLQLSSTGSLVTAGLRAMRAEDGLRSEVGSVAVPFGMCTEPSNVQAGGHSCPYRMKCLGCSHFRTDPSYLPELNEYLTQLLVSKERLQSAGSAVEPWARRSAMPSDEEINRVRHLIRRCEISLDALSEDERRNIDACIAQVRTGRGRTAHSIPLQLLGSVRSQDPGVFPGTAARLRRFAEPTSIGAVR